MRKSLFAPIAALLMVASVATAGSVSFKDSSGATVSIATLTLNGLNYYLQGLIDTTGTQIDPATKQQQQAMLDRLGAIDGAAATTFDATPSTLLAQAKQQSGKLATLAGTVGAAGAPTGNAQTVQGSPNGTPINVSPLLPQLTATPGTAISFGTSAATLFNANAARHFIALQVQGAPDTAGTNGCWINGSTTATADANSLFIPRGSYFESTTHVGVGAISIICSATFGVYSRQG